MFKVPSNPNRASIRRCFPEKPCTTEGLPEPVELITFVFPSSFGGFFFHGLIFCSSCPCCLQVAADVPCAVSLQEEGKDHSLFAFCLALWNVWVSSSLLLSWRETLFYPASHPCPFPILPNTFFPSFCHSTCAMFCSPLCISVTRKAFIRRQYFNFSCFSWRCTLAKNDMLTVSAGLLLPTALAGKLLGRNPDLCEAPMPAGGFSVGVLCFGKYSLCLGGFSCSFKAVSWCLCVGLKAKPKKHHCPCAIPPDHHSNKITCLAHRSPKKTALTFTSTHS